MKTSPKLWNLVFPIRIHDPREAINRSGKKKICNLQYGSRTQLVKGIHVIGKGKLTHNYVLDRAYLGFCTTL